MARKRLYEYSFTPGTSGLGTIQVQNRYNLADFLAVYDTTADRNIYNFAEPTLGGTVAFTAGVSATFPAAYAGVTTLSLTADTSTLNSADELAIYVEDYNGLTTQPWSFGEDAIGRSRVGQPESLIDADFEYGYKIPNGKTSA